MNEKELANRVLGLKDMPEPDELIFEPTSQCNFSCKMCFIDHAYTRSNRKEMSFDQIKACVDKLPKKIKHVTLIGGEPLLRKDIVEIIGSFANRNIKVHISSNGYLLKPELSRKLKKLGNVVSIGVSLDGAPSFHNKIRGVKDAFERTFENIKYASQYFNIQIVSVVQNDNYRNLVELLEYIKDIPRLTFSTEIVRGYSRSCIDESLKALNIPREELSLREQEEIKSRNWNIELLENLEMIKKKAIREGIKYFTIPYSAVNNILYMESSRFGVAPLDEVCSRFLRPRLDSSGNIVHCYAIRTSFGSLLDEDFQTLWNSEKIKRFRKKLIENNLPSICKACLARTRTIGAETAEAENVKSTNTIKVGIVGFGNIGQQYFKSIKKNKGVELVGVYSRSGDRIHSSISINILTILEDLVKKSDLIIIATEPGNHLPVIEEIVKLGSPHLLIEKPHTATITSSVQLLGLEKKQSAGTIWGCSYQYRFSWLYHFIEKYCQSGDLGRPKWFNIEYSYSRDDNYYLEGNGWRKQKGGNVIFNQGIHIFDFINGIFGLPESVFCLASQVKHKSVEYDTVKVLMKFEKDLIATVGITVAASMYEPRMSMKLKGDKSDLEMTSDGIRIFKGKQIIPWKYAFMISYVNSFLLNLFTLVEKVSPLKSFANKLKRFYCSFFPFIPEKLFFLVKIKKNVSDFNIQFEDFISSIRQEKLYKNTLQNSHEALLIAEAADRSLISGERILLKNLASSDFK